jgi:hypothetical protein
MSDMILYEYAKPHAMIQTSSGDMEYEAWFNKECERISSAAGRTAKVIKRLGLVSLKVNRVANDVSTRGKHLK